MHDDDLRFRRPESYGRRDFLRRGAALGLGAGLLPAAAGAEPANEAPEAPQVLRRAVLGRTGIEIPDISFGGFVLDGDVGLVHHALDRGVTHFDTAEGYVDGESERTLGRALAGKRSQVTLTTKHMPEADASREQMMRALEGSLKRLQTDYVDVFLNHAVNQVARIANPEWAEFVTLAKRQGKIRAAGMSGHGGYLVPSLDYGLDHDLLDVVLVAYNYAHSPDFTALARQYWHQLTGRLDFVALQPELPRVLARAEAKGVGVMAMKTLRGSRYNDLRPYEREGGTYSQAAFRWVLSDPRVHGLVITMNDRAQVDEFLGASGARDLREHDLGLLLRYESLNRSSQCQPGCGACADACPASVEVSEVLRARKYGRDYEQLGAARAVYASIGVDASPCVSCADARCVAACPGGVRIPELARDAHQLLG